MTAAGGHMTACCNAPLRVGGNVTHWYECSKCGKAVDEMSARKYLDEVQARADKATPGPWRHSVTVRNPRDIVDARSGKLDITGTRSKTRRADAAFIAAARTDVPKLADMLRIALDALERVKEHGTIPSNDYRTKYAIPDDQVGPDEVRIVKDAALAAANEHADRLAIFVRRCRTILGNMALENPPGVKRLLARWKISDEPLRNDAMRIVLELDALLAEHEARKGAGLGGLQGGGPVPSERAESSESPALRAVAEIAARIAERNPRGPQAETDAWARQIADAALKEYADGK